MPLDRFSQDIRDAWRSLRRSPIATIVAVLSLAAGIGATTVSLTVREILFRRPPPSYVNPAQLSRVQVGTPGNPIRPIGNPIPLALYTRWQEVLGPAIGGSTSLGHRTVRVNSRQDEISIRAATPSLFSVLGVEPMLGASFTSPTLTSSASTLDSSVILSYRVWQQLFDEKPDAIGQSLWIADRSYTVIGVMPPRFYFSDMDSPIWTALDVARAPADSALSVVVRRATGETSGMLEARLKSSVDEYASQLPEGQRPLLFRASGIEGTPTAQQMSFVLPYVLGTAVLLTLLIACANVAILLMARWTAREHEIAIRASIGASRGRIIRSLLTESVTIAACGALLGVGFTFVLSAVIAARSSGGAMFDLSVDWRIMVEATAIALAAGVISGMIPALHETRRLQDNPLRSLAAGDRARQRWRHSLVVVEITVTFALLVVTTAMIDGYFRAVNADLGYAPGQLMMVRVENPAGVPTSRVVDVLKNIPGVAGASASESIPFTASGARVPISGEGGSDPVVTERAEIDDQFFQALGVRLLAGRSFRRGEPRESGTAIVNQVFADRFFAGRDPIGRRVFHERTPYEIVGLVANYASNPMRAALPEPRLFVPLGPESPNVTRMHFLVRAEHSPLEFRRRIRDDIARLGGGTIVTRADAFTQVLDVMGQEMIVGTAPLVPLVTIGVLLTAAGIYGVLAFAIARRSRELAVRIAVGATAFDVVRVVAMHTVRLVAFGSASGLTAMYALANLVRSQGGAGSIWDPSWTAFVLPVVLVASVAAIAAWVPSRRALAIDPVVLLRQQ